MDTKNEKCSSKKHNEINAISYCQECNIYMCNKCESHHLELFDNHHQYKLDKNINEIFTGFCKEKNHIDKLDYYCRNHNQLCCSSCIIKIKRKGKGQHTDCDVCNIEDIKDEKKNKLKENITILENLFNKINEDKEVLKEKIQKIFTNIRNEINAREDNLLIEVDKKFENIFFKGEKMKKLEKLPNKIKISLEKGKIIDNEWNDDNKLRSIINDCINIENNIKDIDLLNKNNELYKSKKYNIRFIPEETELNKFLENIKTFGNIYYNTFEYKIKKCPLNITENRKYVVSGNKDNILTKTGTDHSYMGTNLRMHIRKIKNL